MAAAKARAAERAGRMTTRTVSAETVFNLSSTKNIRDSLLKFGIDDGDRSVSQADILFLKHGSSIFRQYLVQGDTAPLFLYSVDIKLKVERACVGSR